jgi:isochorismate synthase EntC
MTQAVIQQQSNQQQAPVNQFENSQQVKLPHSISLIIIRDTSRQLFLNPLQMQQQQTYQQQPQQQPLQSITNNNNNQMPPVATQQPAHQNYEKCIRNGCLNPAIVVRFPYSTRESISAIAN